MKTKPKPPAKLSRLHKPEAKRPASVRALGSDLVLLAVTGMSPAILTETVWALAQETPPVIPQRVIVLTTLRGRAEIERELFTASPEFGGACVWDALRATLQRKGHDLDGRLRFGTTADDVRVFTAQNSTTGRSTELEDIRTPAENAAVADFVLEEVRRIVENPDTRLVASIAGGRKTMGALLYACLTLIGRETDRLTHVLVNEPFEDPRLRPKFFFTGQPAVTLTRPDGSKAKTSSARIDLADVPFVPLRNLFHRELRRMPGRFSALVERCRERVEQVAAEDLHLMVHRSKPEIEVNGESVRLSVPEYVILRCLAEHAREKRPAIDGYESAANAVRALAETVHEEHDRNDFSDWRYKALPPGKEGFAAINDRWITKNLSSAKDKLKDAGPTAAALVRLLPARGRFSIDLPPARIRIAA